MKKIVMIGTGFDTMGGISSVVNVYRSAGLFQRFPIHYLATHCDGGAGAKLRAMALAYLGFLRLLLAGRIGLLHVHTASRASFWRKFPFFALALLCRVPAILHLHGAEFHLFYRDDCGRLRQWLVRSVLRRVDRVIVLSATWADWVRGVCPAARVEVLYNPVMLPAQATPWPSRAAGEALFLGRIGERKGCYDLLAAAAALAPTRPQLQLRMGGDGDVDLCLERARSLGLADRVSMLGWVRGDSKERQLARATVFALPSYNEGLPMGLLEAMAAGLPVLASTVGGIPEAVSDGVEGFLVAPGDVAALTERWRRLLDDDALACRMGAAARRKVELHFSAEAVLPLLERLYVELGAGQ